MLALAEQTRTNRTPPEARIIDPSQSAGKRLTGTGNGGDAIIESNGTLEG